MKNKILALLATIGLASSVTAVEINENLSINGFIDGSYYDGDTANGNKSFNLDEVEVNIEANVGNVSGFVGIDSIDTAGNSDFNIEQAHFTYALDNGVSFTFGQYGSALGLEGEDPAGLYTYSRAYTFDATALGVSTPSFNLANIDELGSVAGLTIAYSADNFSVGISIEEDGNFGQTDDDLNIEIAASYTGIDNLTIGGGYFIDNGAAGAERDVLNIHAAYSVGKALIAGEIISADDSNARNGEDAYMLLVDYDFNDKLGGAIRFSEYEVSNTQEGEKFTIAPNYSITESLGAIVEFSTGEVAGTDADELAIELTYTF
jgi:hypothetical protein